MTEYRRSHRVCGWSGCDQSKSLHVHHILPLNKYPEYMDEKWNFICYCPFHHFAYHYTFSVSRNDNRHRNALHMLWANTEKWALKNKISIDDLEIELDQMYTPKVIFNKSLRLSIDFLVNQEIINLEWEIRVIHKDIIVINVD